MEKKSNLHLRMPGIGDVYQEVRDDSLYVAVMVIGIMEGAVYVGTGLDYFWCDLADTNQWTLIKDASAELMPQVNEPIDLGLDSVPFECNPEDCVDEPFRDASGISDWPFADQPNYSHVYPDEEPPAKKAVKSKPAKPKSKNPFA